MTITQWRRRINSDAGFSLSELLVVITLLSVVGGMVVAAIITTTRIERKNDSVVLQRTDAQIALQRLGRDLTVADPLTAAAANDATMRVYRDGYCELHRWYVTTGSDLALAVRRYPASTTCTNAIGALSAVTTTIVAEDVANGATPLFAYSRWSGTLNQRAAIASPVASTSVGQIDRVETTLMLGTLSSQPIVEQEAVDLRNVEIK
jgi:type II secretory pathway component PulJ